MAGEFLWLVIGVISSLQNRNFPKHLIIAYDAVVSEFLWILAFSESLAIKLPSVSLPRTAVDRWKFFLWTMKTVYCLSLTLARVSDKFWMHLLDICCFHSIHTCLKSHPSKIFASFHNHSSSSFCSSFPSLPFNFFLLCLPFSLPLPFSDIILNIISAVTFGASCIYTYNSYMIV